MRLTFVLPHLFWPEPEDPNALEKLSCPGLEWLFAHGNARRSPPAAYEHTLAEAFGLDMDAPFGSLRLLGENAGGTASLPDAREGFWLCADPVHLRFHHERIVLADAGAFELEEDEARALVADLNREFADMGQFHVAASRRWYLRLTEAGDYPALPLSAVAGRRMDGQLPDQPQASRLRSWLNEIQMFLHGHPVNSRRASSGKPAVNSLWLWGAGHLPSPRDQQYDLVRSDDPLALGLALAAGIATCPVPRDLAALLAEGDGDSRQLVVVDSLLPPVLYEDSRGWRQAMEKLEAAWFKPLQSALGRQVKEITLLAPTVYGQLAWGVQGGERWKFWVRPKSLPTHIRELVQ